MSIVPVWDRQRIGELPILIHEVELIPRQKHGQNQLHLQLGHFHPRTWVPTGSPTEERIDSVREWVGSQPPTRVVLVWVGVVFGAQVNFAQAIREEISLFYHLFANSYYLFTNVPPEDDTGDDNSVRLPDAGKEATTELFTMLYTYVETRRDAELTSDAIDVLIAEGETTQNIVGVSAAVEVL